MKITRITSLVVAAFALLLVLGQLGSRAQAAPHATPHYQAKAITAQINPPTKQGVGKAKTTQPTLLNPIDFTIQGRLTDSSGNPITVATAVVFSLYNTPTGGNAEMTQSDTITP